MANNRKWNNINWNDKIDEVIYFIKTGITPYDDISKIKQKNYANKFNNFVIRNGELVLKDTGQIVVLDNKQDIIEQIFDEYGIGSGIENLYNKISGKYLNIKRTDVSKFFKSNEIYQLSKNPLKRTNKKIYSSGLHKVWNVDLIDINTFAKSNNNYRYIMTVVDSFSKFVMMAKLKTKTASSVVNAFENSILLQSRGAVPKSLVSDNGLEFKNDLMDEFCNEHGIKQIFGQTYNPKSNALAESTNNIIRKVMRAVFLKYGETNWISHLDEILNSINSSKAYSTGKVRSQVFYDNKYVDEIHSHNLKQKRQLKYDDEINSFKVGDRVRLSLNSVETEIRKRNKQNLSKYVIAKFSYDIYTVVKIVKSKNKFTKDRYKVKDINNNVLSKQFY